MKQAVILADRKLIKSLLDQGARLDGTLNVAAKYHSKADTVEYLLGLGARDPHGQALSSAARQNRLEVAQTLLAHHVNSEATTKSDTLHNAAFAGHTDMVRLLLDNGFAVDKPNAEGVTSLILACSAGQPYPKVLQLLLERGADVNAPVRGPLATGLFAKGDTPCELSWTY